MFKVLLEANKNNFCQNLIKREFTVILLCEAPFLLNLKVKENNEKNLLLKWPPIKNRGLVNFKGPQYF